MQAYVVRQPCSGAPSLILKRKIKPKNSEFWGIDTYFETPLSGSISCILDRKRSVSVRHLSLVVIPWRHSVSLWPSYRVNSNISVVYFPSGQWLAFDLPDRQLTSLASNCFSLFDNINNFYPWYCFYVIIKLLSLPYSFHLVQDPTLAFRFSRFPSGSL